jgi:hypothetical protein
MRIAVFVSLCGLYFLFVVVYYKLLPEENDVLSTHKHTHTHTQGGGLMWEEEKNKRISYWNKKIYLTTTHTQKNKLSVV